jgi:DNA-binding CsgD family transcriptional regulator
MSSTNLLDGISKRERDIVRLLVIVKTSEEIADNLNISKHTVDTHRRNILKKLNVSSTAELTAYFKNYPCF